MTISIRVRFPSRVIAPDPEQDVAVKRIVLSAFAMSAVALAACSDTNAPSSSASQLAITMASAYSETPAGFSELSSSFAASDNDDPFLPDFGPMGDGHGQGGRGGFGFGPVGSGPGLGLGFMGGGLFGPFLGDGIEPFFRGDSSCTYSASTGVTTCGPTTHDGLSETRTTKFTTGSGTAQQKRDSTTNTAVTSATVTGTTTMGRDSSTSTVNESSKQTISGLAKGSTQLSVASTSASSESTTGTSKEGAFTAKRTASDTITGIIIPVPASTSKTAPYPTAGAVIRSMAATVTITGQSPTTSSRREVVTYDGSTTAKVVITQDGTTQNCTLPLPFGHLTCQ
ncbi:MAG TPA: hypothetical protein VHV78_08685 [Gemmatimonadaceae bacterium]|nr:hypothetical protein [Gemmatimonadaceae bacterium]